MGKSLVAIATAVSAAASIAGGLSQASEANRQASNERADAEARIRAEAREGLDAEKRQKLAYLSSGVSLEGSPLLTLQETRNRTSENLENISRSSMARQSSIRASGRQALFSGISKGVGKGFGAYDIYRKGKK